MTRRIPAALVALRAACAPALLALERAGAPGTALAAVVTAAFLSDLLDGILARRLGVATERLRRADSVADAVFYAAALGALVLRAPGAVRAALPGIAAIVALELVRLGVERARYGRMAAYHMWSAKAWGVALWLGVSEAFVTGAAGPFFLAAVVLGVLADLEGLAASLVLSRWHHDVPSLWHALRIEGGKEAR